MAANSFYFDHDYDAASDDKMMVLFARYKEEELKAYGAYWRLIEAMARKSDTVLTFFALEGLAPKFSTTQDWLNQFVETCLDIGLLTLIDGKTFTSLRLLEHKAWREKNKQKKQEAGRKGGLAKAANCINALADFSNAIAPLQQNVGEVEQIVAKSTIGKDRIGKDRIGESIVTASPIPSLFDSDLITPNTTNPEGEVKPPKASVKRFVKPTLEELAAYFIERGAINPKKDAQEFFDNYEIKGWVIGKNPMKNWKSAVGTWMSRPWYGQNNQPQATNGIAPGGQVAPGTKLRF